MEAFAVQKIPASAGCHCFLSVCCTGEATLPPCFQLDAAPGRQSIAALARAGTNRTAQRPFGNSRWLSRPGGRGDGPRYLLAACWRRFTPKAKSPALAGRIENIRNVMKREHLRSE